jgi:hypothetical protein
VFQELLLLKPFDPVEGHQELYSTYETNKTPYGTGKSIASADRRGGGSWFVSGVSFRFTSLDANKRASCRLAGQFPFTSWATAT